jgi:hypothetical protein
VREPDLRRYLRWLEDDVIPGFQRSEQPSTWKAESIRRATAQAEDIRARLMALGSGAISGANQGGALIPYPCAIQNVPCPPDTVENGQIQPIIERMEW